MILGVALLTPSGIEGGLLHIANHAFSKITLFFCAGAIYVAAHKKDISEMSGLGQVMPLTFAAFAVASLSMIGVPPVAGFVSKWYLAVGSLEAHQIGLLAVLLASTLLNAGYFVPVTYRAFFGRLAPADRHLKEASLAMVIPLLLTAAISLCLGIFPDFFMTLRQRSPAMKLVALIEFLQKHLRQVRIDQPSARSLLLVVCDWLFVDKSHAHTAPEGIPGLLVPFRIRFLRRHHLLLQVVRTSGNHDPGGLLR